MGTIGYLPTFGDPYLLLAFGDPNLLPAFGDFYFGWIISFALGNYFLAAFSESFPPVEFGDNFPPVAFGESFPPAVFGDNFPPAVFGDNFPLIFPPFAYFG